VTWPVATLLLATGAGAIVALSSRLLHVLQLEHYESARLFWWLRTEGNRYCAYELLNALALVGLAALTVIDRRTSSVVGVVLAVAIAAWHWRQSRVPPKKPFVLTGRAERLIMTTAALETLACAAVIVGVATTLPPLAAIAVGIALGIVGAPFVILVASAVMAPVEKRVNQGFIEAARGRLREVAPHVVGVTGSYGKTTTKFCIAAVLEEIGSTTATRESFNSYLGVVRSINEDLRANDRFFVAEMGMYRQGDIRELCELVGPEIGVLTAVGPAHLERLGSIEAIARAKAEIAEALPPDGVFITNHDDPRCMAIARDVRVKVVTFGFSRGAGVRARDVELVDGSTRFVLERESEETVIRSKLLGAHNVYNLLAAAACGYHLGVPTSSIMNALGRISPPPHRLQPITNAAAGVVVIDDAYNSNPVGASAALTVLGDHVATRRIVVTPGMVELGSAQFDANRAFGAQAAKVCDVVIVVGTTNRDALVAGLRDNGFEHEAIVLVPNLEVATAELGRRTRRGDVVLIENDLPDTYLSAM
jgi:UDP-N-acetylmuramoyl-tripeptide--D-alanyl-D-alanine ligase